MILVSESEYLAGRLLQSGTPGGHLLSIGRTRVLKPDPDVVLRWGGSKGFLARLNLHSIPEHQIRQGGRSIEVATRAEMETSFRDIHEPCEWPMVHALDQICFELPSEAVAIWAESPAVARSVNPRFSSGQSSTDPVLGAFGLAILPILDGRARATQFFVDHVLDGVCSYIFETPPVQQKRGRGGLAPWQLSRAKDLMLSNMASDLSLSDIAAACGLSVAHFGRAFSRSCGTNPHKWLTARRLDKAENLLKKTDLPLTSVAAECGFSDQAHLSNAFSRHFGTPPGAFRRYWQNRSYQAV